MWLDIKGLKKQGGNGVYSMWKIIISDLLEESEHQCLYSMIPKEEEEKRGLKSHIFWQQIGDEITALAADGNLPFEAVTEYLKKAKKNYGKRVSLYIEK